ncbi:MULTISPECIES: phage holin family protein [unclassified Curtobacterium]|uniref:phage holin family protein n=1 Tax=unclassified Curtobacterium TaxID=257496 RepID=UPI000DA8D789|nr:MULTISPECIES: phage holin family protein [unclassified Curtobacterium]PZE26048.1 phage holin family protein [Curtobacterium sp. MCBD17_028]PZE77748.1 phage holin family protein [Curtobacterium sp. MCBD17_019]PZF62043.1 phage holin family protein [Curtobacterium sp. MCBD17_034]PZM34024.1 phage holin family protein [Curtobacterium sp. MCBD17_031]WIB63668.1 phage holin family protein [Curtobacterium sp. MCBD17_040]
MSDTRSGERRSRSLFGLVSDVPRLVRELVRGELALLKAEMLQKAKIFAFAAAFLIVAVVILFYAIGVFLTAAVLGLATVMPGWLAAIIVAVVLLIIAAVLGLLGYRRIKTGLPPLPARTIQSVKNDVNAVRGMGRKPKPPVQQSSRRPDVDGTF